MVWNRRRVLASLAVAAAPASTLARSPGPALWEVRERGARVLLFGDCPALRTPWRSDRIEAFVSASAAFWRDTPVTSDTALFFAKGIDPARPLSSWLTKTDRARVAAAAAAVGMGDAALERFRPWLASVILEDRVYAHTDLKPQNAPQPKLTAIAEAAGKPIRSEFPDTAAVVDYFASLSRAAEVGALLRAVDDIEAGPAAAERDAEAWANGDQTADRAAVLHVRSAYPDYYLAILAERNRRWPARIRAMLDGGGTSFVLVGSYHLVGPDSVQSQLAAAGMLASRI